MPDRLVVFGPGDRSTPCARMFDARSARAFLASTPPNTADTAAERDWHLFAREGCAMAAMNNVTAEVIVRIAGHEVAAGSFEIPLHVARPDEHGNAVVTIPEDAALQGFRTLAIEMAEKLA